MKSANEVRRAFRAQRQQAIQRGIDWMLTFDEWLAWWGEDLSRRGRGRDDLQMQRLHDKGPYALWNIRKGSPLENMRTAGANKRNRAAQKAKEAHERFLDALMLAASEPDEDPKTLEEELEDEITSVMCAKKVSFLLDKHR